MPRGWKEGFDFQDQRVPHGAEVAGAVWKQEERVGFGFFLIQK